MKNTAIVIAVTVSLAASHASAADDPQRNLAYQDHIAYVATFSLPVLIEKCADLDPGYLHKAAPLYFRYINTHQDQIERGRLLTLAELSPGQTVKGYREEVVASRLSRLDTGTHEQKLGLCAGALGMMSGAAVPGEWPPRRSTNGGQRQPAPPARLSGPAKHAGRSVGHAAMPRKQAVLTRESHPSPATPDPVAASMFSPAGR